MNKSKRWYQSRTIWLNILIAGVAATDAIINEGSIDEETSEMLVFLTLALNIALRYFTNKPIATRKQQEQENNPNTGD